MPKPDPPPAPPRRRDPEATRGAILDAAEALFLDRGIADTPTSAIARKAGVTKSLIHHHFGSKEALWREVKQRRFASYGEAQHEMLVGAEGSLELLRSSVVRYFRFLQADPAAVRLMAWRFVDSEDPCLEQEETLYQMGVERIQEAQAAGDLRSDLEPIMVLKIFLGLCLYWFQSKHLLCQMMPADAIGDDVDDVYLETLLRVYFDGIRPRAEGDGEDEGARTGRPAPPSTPASES